MLTADQLIFVALSGMLAVGLVQAWMLFKMLRIERRVRAIVAEIPAKVTPPSSGGGFPQGWRPIIETELSVISSEASDTGMRYTLTNGTTTFYLTL